MRHIQWPPKMCWLHANRFIYKLWSFVWRNLFFCCCWKLCINWKQFKAVEIEFIGLFGQQKLGFWCLLLNWFATVVVWVTVNFRDYWINYQGFILNFGGVVMREPPWPTLALPQLKYFSYIKTIRHKSSNGLRTNLTLCISANWSEKCREHISISRIGIKPDVISIKYSN